MLLTKPLNWGREKQLKFVIKSGCRAGARMKRVRHLGHQLQGDAVSGILSPSPSPVLLASLGLAFCDLVHTNEAPGPECHHLRKLHFQTMLPLFSF